MGRFEKNWNILTGKSNIAHAHDGVQKTHMNDSNEKRVFNSSGIRKMKSVVISAPLIYFVYFHNFSYFGSNAMKH